MTVTAYLQADLATIPDGVNVGARTVVAVPPSDIDPVWDEMRVAINGSIILRAFDPGAAIVTGAPIALLTEAGETLITEASERIVSEVSV